MNLSRIFSKDVAKDVFQRSRDHDINDLSAAIAYRVFVAMLPLLVFIAAVSSLTTKLFDVRDPAERLVATMSDAMPEDVASVLETQIREVLDAPGGIALVLGLLGALWTGSLAVNTTVKWLNRVHETEDSRSVFHRWALNVALTAGAGLLLTVSFIGFFALQLFGPEITSEVGLDEGFATAISAIRWPLAFALVVLAAAVLYKLGPDKPRDVRWVSLGALGFGLIWLAGSFGFGFYLANFGSYNTTYGVLGALLVLMTWFYITSFAFLAGAEVDAAIARQAGEPREQPGEHSPSRSTAPTPMRRQAEPPPGGHGTR